MAKRHILTVDVGTSSTKTAVWNQQGTVLAEASAAYTLHRPSPLVAEIDANVWWEAVCRTVQQVIAEADIHPDDVAGIGIDGVGWTLIPVDQDVNPLAPAMIWLDRRAEAETAWLNSLPNADQLINLVANPIDEAYITPKLVWLKQNQPQIFDDAHQFLAATGFVVARFTGAFTCDFTQAYGYHFFDIRNERWDSEAAAIDWRAARKDATPVSHNRNCGHSYRPGSGRNGFTGRAFPSLLAVWMRQRALWALASPSQDRPTSKADKRAAWVSVWSGWWWNHD